MSRRILGHLRTHVIAYVALFFALTGGTAFALTGSNTVFSDDITNGEVKTADIGGGEVRSPDILDSGVKATDIADGHVRSPEIADNAVGSSEIAPAAVDTSKIADNAVASSKIQANAVDSSKIADNAVGSSKIADLAVTTGKLGGASVTAPKLANTQDGLTTVNLAANSTTNVTATCPAGGQALSGGYFTPASGVVQVTRTRRDSDNTWVFTFRNTAATVQGVDARVTCLVG
jgi:hypothetical protein